MEYNIQKTSLILLGCLMYLTNVLYAQMTVSKYGTEIIASKSVYRSTVSMNPDKNMIPLKQSIPGLILDLRYATDQNFTGHRMYPTRTHETYLRSLAASALRNVQHQLHAEGLGLKIFDAYRPYSVTVNFWELIHDERYVAHPAKGSGHNRGLAVDLTLINLQTGKELDMGTGFDNFSDTAHHSFMQLSPLILNNRMKLKKIMIAAGFSAFETEWWHYSWPNTIGFEVLDLPFSKLQEGK